MKGDLQQQITQLLAQVGEVAARDRISDRIGFFERIGRNRSKVLLQVPRASGAGRAQRSHDFNQTGDIARGFHGENVLQFLRFTAHRRRSGKRRKTVVPRIELPSTARLDCAGIKAVGRNATMMTVTRTLLASAAGIGMMLAIAGQPASAATVRVYATNSGGDVLHVIDPSTNKVVSTLDVFDQKSGTLIKKVALSGHPNNIAVAKDGRIVVAIARDPGGLDIIDPVKLERKVTVLTRGRLHNTYVTPDGTYAIMGSTRTSVFSVVDLAKEELAWDLNIGKGVRPMTMDVNPDGSTRNVYIQTSDLNGFVVLDFAARKVVKTVELPNDGGVEVIHHRLDSPSHGIGVAPDNKTLWVTSILANAVFAYSLPDLKQIGRVELPQLKVTGRDPMASVPNWVTFTPDSKQLYISNAAMNSVTAIDTVAMKQMAVIPVGNAPKRIGTLVAP